MHKQSLLALALAFSTTPLLSQTASYALRGHGCNGSPVSSCVTLNDQNPVFRLASLPNEYGYPVINTTSAPIYVLGFEVFTQSNTGLSETGLTAIYLDNSGPAATTHTAPSVTSSANGTITVNGTVGWYSTVVSPAIAIPAGGAFWLGMDAYSRLAPPQNTGGAAGPTPPWWRRTNASPYPWTVSGSVATPIWKVHCAAGSTPVPSLTVSGPPRLGQAFNLQISQGVAYLPAFIIWGFNNTNWLAFTLPTDLGIFGAPACLNYTSTDSFNLMLLDPQGAVTIPMNIPNVAGLAGFAFFNQAATMTPGANPLGLLTTNYGAGVVGN